MKTRKTSKANLEIRKPLFFSIGLAFGLAFTLVAFEWRQQDVTAYDVEFATEDPIEVEMLPIYRIEVPKAPEPKPSDKSTEIVIDDHVVELVEKEIEPTDLVEDIPFKTAPDPIEKVSKPAPKIHTYVDQTAQFKGGYTEMLRYLSSKVKYTDYARELGVQGKVFIEFVVRKDGSITDVKLKRGIGAGLDKIALNVVKSMPKWEPGVLKGKPVDMYFNLPIDFRLE